MSKPLFKKSFIIYKAVAACRSSWRNNRMESFLVQVNHEGTWLCPFNQVPFVRSLHRTLWSCGRRGNVMMPFGLHGTPLQPWWNISGTFARFFISKVSVFFFFFLKKKEERDETTPSCVVCFIKGPFDVAACSAIRSKLFPFLKNIYQDGEQELFLQGITHLYSAK